MPWYPDGTGLQPGGDVGGDAQMTDAASLRYHHTDRPGALVTLYAYGICDTSTYPGFAVQIQTEFMICRDRRDPGSTEAWSEATYTTLPAIHPTPQAAEAAARAFLTRHTAADLHWDGFTRKVT